MPRGTQRPALLAVKTRVEENTFPEHTQEETVSPAWETDAAHIAITTVNGLDFIVSLNFTHIARAWTDERVRRVNVREGYQGIGIYKPEEVLEL
jgi:hypothetical protein